jgi:hypothetical protein
MIQVIKQSHVFDYKVVTDQKIINMVLNMKIFTIIDVRIFTFVFELISKFEF